ncbi:hypothetical protein ADJ73_16360 [Arsenicicoccus sp. oral taxon 190]|nr:hypothetical protein ADJ73_16360 [Arsenicicoccus sp. oral taxon 190]
MMAAALAAGPTPVPVAANPGYAMPSVAAVFASPTATQHGCSGAVLDSPTGSLVVTAAHCVSDRGTGLRVVPGYSRGRAPYGTWAVTAAYVDPGWQATADPHRDLAVLRVGTHLVGGRVRTLAGTVGGYHLGEAPASGAELRGYGYVAGSGDQAVGCVNAITLTNGYPTFPCGEMWGGVSGTALTSAGADGSKTVRGVIGGLHEGGCYPDVSYSSPFGAWSTQLVQRASAGGPGDVVRNPVGDGC